MSERGIDVKHWAGALALGLFLVLLLLPVGFNPLGPVEHGGSSSFIIGVAETSSADFGHEADSHSGQATTCHAGAHCSPVALFATSIAGQRIAARTMLHHPPSRLAGSRLIDPNIRPPIA